MRRRMGIIVPRVARRVASGKTPQPGWLPRRWLTVASGDVDLDGGIGAVWLLRRAVPRRDHHPCGRHRSRPGAARRFPQQPRPASGPADAARTPLRVASGG
jgi:hypothetical protein